MTKKKEAPKPRVRKCEHNDEFVEAYFDTLPNPTIVMRCATCWASRASIGEYPNGPDSYDPD